MATISRWKLARSRFATGPGAAWNWRYRITMDDGSEAADGLEMLSIARRIAAEKAKASGEAIREEWQRG